MTYTIEDRSGHESSYEAATPQDALEAIITDAGGWPGELEAPCWTQSARDFQADASIDYLITVRS